MKPQWFEQEKQTSCVAACVRMVLSSYGVSHSEVEIRQWLGNPQLGITLNAALAHLEIIGAATEWHDDWNVDDLRDALRQGAYPIVGVERHIFGAPSARHAVVLISLTSQAVQVLDPLAEPNPQKYSLPTFARAWRLAGQEALLILSPPESS